MARAQKATVHARQPATTQNLSYPTGHGAPTVCVITPPPTDVGRILNTSSNHDGKELSGNPRPLPKAARIMTRLPKYPAAWSEDERAPTRYARLRKKRFATVTARKAGKNFEPETIFSHIPHVITISERTLTKTNRKTAWVAIKRLFDSGVVANAVNTPLLRYFAKGPEVIIIEQLAEQTTKPKGNDVASIPLPPLPLLRWERK